MDIKKRILKEKILLLRRYKVIEEFLIDRIANGEERGDELSKAQVDIDELTKIIKFLKDK